MYKRFAIGQNLGMGRLCLTVPVKSGAPMKRVSWGKQVIGTKFVLYRESHSKPKEKRIRLVKSTGKRQA